MAKRSALADKLDQIKDRIAAAAVKAKREPAEVTMMAVTKYAAPEQIREILALGVADLGESKVQQLVQRAAQLNEFVARRASSGINEAENVMPDKIRWHMIGHLQRNKVKPVLPLVSIVHSVDSLRLAEEIETYATKLGRVIPVMLQINASEENTKFGVAVGAAVHLAEQIDTMESVQLVGLMTMAAIDAPEPAIRQTFSRTREIFDELKWHKIGKNHLRHLSMGMSHDFELAIAEGATIVRIGSELFGGTPEGEEEGE